MTLTYRHIRFVITVERGLFGALLQHVICCLSFSMNTSLFQYAGIKDKRGKTCQEVTIHK